MRKPSHLLRWLLPVAAALYACSPIRMARAEGEGAVQVQAQLKPLPADGLATLELTLRDEATGQPVSLPARRLAAWLQKPLPTLSEGELACRDKVRMLASPGLGRRAAVDFNIHRLLAVNTDNTLTFINPFLRLNQAKLEDVLTLPGTPVAVLQRADVHEVWLALPEVDQVLVVDTDARRVRRSYKLANGARPVALAEAGGAIWVAQAGRDEWLRIANAQSDPERIAAPRVQAWLLPDQASEPLGLGVDGIVRVPAQIGQGAQIAQVAPTGRLLHAVWSPLAQRALAAPAAGGLVWLDARGTAQQHIDTTSAVQRIALFDEGRHALATTATDVLVIDVATTRVLQQLPLESAITDIAFSGSFAYLHSAVASRAMLLSLADLRNGKAKPVQVAVGAQPRDAAPSLAPGSGAHRLQRLPDGAGMYVASPHDGQIYQYTEGMMAPIGSFSNYRRSPLALLLLDDGLQSLGEGRYRATLRAPRSGNYELVVSGVQPRFAECVALEVPVIGTQNQSAVVAAAAQVRARLLQVKTDGEGWLVRAALSVGEGDKAQPLADVRDLQLLVFDKRSGWQTRRTMRFAGDGIYEARIAQPPGQTSIDLLVSSASHDLPFHAGALGSHVLGGLP
ncbi:hypothetical protein G7048_16215 [Diaphorobacter sp. HDW4B]|uniref:YncE family protein n=1 Tax=Diaphorobacter sp. HDW4B TaxID=2714925 RepID=UPI00140B0CBE|nr:hypothetical protein [Diaphorobacter sp. HDW4B]QIL71767.1 hypothetical protein G7048_16215 [Diaphorobacter sp. HDW4B]